ncbi:MAG: hypothetical protein HYR60_29520 [Acidobacteria bacterium]|nr:hypothetical protein [Acidobacteriota bacterium]
MREPEPTPLRFGTDEMVLSGGIPAAAKICLVALLVLLPLGKFGYDRWNASSPAPASGGDPFLAVGEGGWSTEWASDVAGSQLGRQLTLYRPSARLANYRVDFEGRIQRGGLGWVFRASDSANYYATKIRLDREGAAFRATLVRWAVIDRKPGPATEKRISLPAGAETIYRVRMDVAGPKFTFYLQDQAVDMWTDQRLKTGGFGFMNDRNEQGQILRVRMSYPEGAGNRNRASSP